MYIHLHNYVHNMLYKRVHVYL